MAKRATHALMTIHGTSVAADYSIYFTYILTPSKDGISLLYHDFFKCLHCLNTVRITEPHNQDNKLLCIIVLFFDKL